MSTNEIPPLRPAPVASRLRVQLASLLVSFCVAALAVPAHAALTTAQLTDDVGASGCESISPAASSDAGVVVFESDCDPLGSNADGSIEIFRLAGDSLEQITSATGCTSMRPSVSNDGTRIAYASTCNPKGGNADGNFEIFLWKSGATAQITTSAACDNLGPSMSGDGGFLAYDSDCIGDQNTDASVEIFRSSHAGVIKQLTRDDTAACDSLAPSIDSSGSLVAFQSDCDLTGENEDFATEIFTVTSGGSVVQRTLAATDACSSVRPSIDGAGSLIAFQSDCDPIGTNADGRDEIFTVSGSGAVAQLTSDSGQSACSSSEPRMSSGGKSVAFSSFCDLTGANSDRSLEAFQVGAGSSSSSPLQITSGESCASIAGTPDQSGLQVLLDSDCDLAGENADLSVEVFRVLSCICGGPASRGSPPKASDALLILRAAVGLSTCFPCECDVDSSGKVSATDALRVLKKVVGQNVTLTCPAA